MILKLILKEQKKNHQTITYVGISVDRYMYTYIYIEELFIIKNK